MSLIAIVVIVTIYAALLAYYCVLEVQEKFWPATIVKLILSACAAGLCVYSAFSLNNYVFYVFALGLVCAIPGDFFLQYIKTDLMKYRIGISLFGLMHICLIVSFYLIYFVTIFEFVIFALLIGIALAFQIIGKWKIGPEKTQLTIYTGVVVFMVAKAISLSFTIPNPDIYILMLSLGSLFFFISDLILGIWAYSNEKTVYLVLNRSTYFVGQLLLAFYLVMQL